MELSLIMRRRDNVPAQFLDKRGDLLPLGLGVPLGDDGALVEMLQTLPPGTRVARMTAILRARGRGFISCGATGGRRGGDLSTGQLGGRGGDVLGGRIGGVVVCGGIGKGRWISDMRGILPPLQELIVGQLRTGGLGKVGNGAHMRLRGMGEGRGARGGPLARDALGTHRRRRDPGSVDLVKPGRRSGSRCETLPMGRKNNGKNRSWTAGEVAGQPLSGPQDGRTAGTPGGRTSAMSRPVLIFDRFRASRKGL